MLRTATIVTPLKTNPGKRGGRDLPGPITGKQAEMALFRGVLEKGKPKKTRMT